MEKKHFTISHGFLLLYNIVFICYHLKATFLVTLVALAQGILTAMKFGTDLWRPEDES